MIMWGICVGTDVQCDRVVLHYADVEPIRTVELDVRTWLRKARARNMCQTHSTVASEGI